MKQHESKAIQPDSEKEQTSFKKPHWIAYFLIFILVLFKAPLPMRPADFFMMLLSYFLQMPGQTILTLVAVAWTVIIVTVFSTFFGLRYVILSYKQNRNAFYKSKLFVVGLLLVILSGPQTYIYGSREFSQFRKDYYKSSIKHEEEFVKAIGSPRTIVFDNTDQEVCDALCNFLGSKGVEIIAFNSAEQYQSVWTRDPNVCEGKCWFPRKRLTEEEERQAYIFAIDQIEELPSKKEGSIIYQKTATIKHNDEVHYVFRHRELRRKDTVTKRAPVDALQLDINKMDILMNKRIQQLLYIERTNSYILNSLLGAAGFFDGYKEEDGTPSVRRDLYSKSSVPRINKTELENIISNLDFDGMLAADSWIGHKSAAEIRLLPGLHQCFQEWLRAQPFFAPDMMYTKTYYYGAEHREKCRMPLNIELKDKNLQSRKDEITESLNALHQRYGSPWRADNVNDTTYDAYTSELNCPENGCLTVFVTGAAKNYYGKFLGDKQQNNFINVDRPNEDVLLVLPPYKQGFHNPRWQISFTPTTRIRGVIFPKETNSQVSILQQEEPISIKTNPFVGSGCPGFLTTNDMISRTVVLSEHRLDGCYRSKDFENTDLELVYAFQDKGDWTISPSQLSTSQQEQLKETREMDKKHISGLKKTENTWDFIKVAEYIEGENFVDTPSATEEDSFVFSDYFVSSRYVDETSGSVFSFEREIHEGIFLVEKSSEAGEAEKRTRLSVSWGSSSVQGLMTFIGVEDNVALLRYVHGRQHYSNNEQFVFWSKPIEYYSLNMQSGEIRLIEN